MGPCRRPACSEFGSQLRNTGPRARHSLALNIVAHKPVLSTLGTSSYTVVPLCPLAYLAVCVTSYRNALYQRSGTLSQNVQVCSGVAQEKPRLEPGPPGSGECFFHHLRPPLGVSKGRMACLQISLTRRH